MPSDKNWPGVRSAIRERMRGKRISDAELARRTRLSPGTIAKIWMAEATFSDANLVNISVALGWPPHYLINMLYGEEVQNESFESLAEETFRRQVLAWLAEIDRKISLMIPGSGREGDDAGSS